MFLCATSMRGRSRSFWQRVCRAPVMISSYANRGTEYIESIAGTKHTRSTRESNGPANTAFAGQPSVYYKVQGDSVAKRSSGAWGARPHLMPSGQDFFTQLRKQVATMDQSKPSQ